MPLQYVNLGRAGLKVSNLCLGCFNFGWRTPEQEALTVIDRALGAGINFLDTANYYSDGRSEEIVGRALQGRRSQVVVATKFHFPVGPGPNDRGNSRMHILRQVEESLRRLGTDYIDLYQVHRPDPDTPVEETLRTLNDLVRAGKIRYYGVSEFAAWQIMEALWTADRLKLERLVSDQPLYNLINRRLENEVVPLSRRYGVGILPFGSLAFGLLTGKYPLGQPYPEDTRGAARNWPADNPRFRRDWEAAMRLAPLAESVGATPSQFAIAWVMGRPGVTSTIIGPRTLAQLEDNLGAADLSLPGEVLEQVDEIVPPGSWPGARE